MNDRVFIDTNILLYARDGGQPAKQLVAHAWMAALWQTRQGRLSFHVLQEFYVNATQKLKPGLPILLARQEVRSHAGMATCQERCSADRVSLDAG